MSAYDESRSGYSVPSYRAHESEAWYHFLHGNVPGHQIDFMYCAEVPQGPLTRQHFSHLSRLMKYIEPQTNGVYAFTIGNLSRDDTQHEPGHGGIGLIFGLRIRGVTDHAGRQDPPFAHAIVTVDRQMDEETLLAAARTFHRHVLGAAESADWYRSYVRCMHEAPASVAEILANYVSGFGDLPTPADSALGLKWITKGAAQPRRIVIAHDDSAPFEVIARCAARIAAVLYQSDIRWTAISNGREADVPNGVSIRFLGESDISAADHELGVRRLEDVPFREEEIARQLFGASTSIVEKPVVRGWRDRYSALPASKESTDEPSIDVPRPSWEGAAPAFRPGAARPAPRERESGPPRLTPIPVNEEDATTLWKGTLERAAPGIEMGDPVEVDLDGGAEEKDVSPASTNGKSVRPAAAVTAARDSGPAIQISEEPAPTTRAEEEENWGKARETMVISAEQAAQAVKAALPFMPAKKQPVAVRAAPVFEPPPVDFRKRPPVLKWTLFAMLVLGAIIALLYLAFADSPPEPSSSGASTSLAAPSTTVPGDPTFVSTAPSSPPPAVTAPAAASLREQAPKPPPSEAKRPVKDPPRAPATAPEVVKAPPVKTAAPKPPSIFERPLSPP